MIDQIMERKNWLRLAFWGLELRPRGVLFTIHHLDFPSRVGWELGESFLTNSPMFCIQICQLPVVCDLSAGAGSHRRAGRGKRGRKKFLVAPPSGRNIKSARIETSDFLGLSTT